MWFLILLGVALLIYILSERGSDSKSTNKTESNKKEDSLKSYDGSSGFIINNISHIYNDSSRHRLSRRGGNRYYNSRPDYDDWY